MTLGTTKFVHSLVLLWSQQVCSFFGGLQVIEYFANLSPTAHIIGTLDSRAFFLLLSWRKFFAHTKKSTAKSILFDRHFSQGFFKRAPKSGRGSSSIQKKPACVSWARLLARLPLHYDLTLPNFNC